MNARLGEGDEARPFQDPSVCALDLCDEKNAEACGLTLQARIGRNVLNKSRAMIFKRTQARCQCYVCSNNDDADQHQKHCTGISLTVIGRGWTHSIFYFFFSLLFYGDELAGLAVKIRGSCVLAS